MRFCSGARARFTAGCALLFLLCATLGCHSRFISATVENQTGGPISPLEVDYPSASFGTESLPTGATYKYRFKVLNAGNTKVLWTDSKHQEHSVGGPSLREGQEGSLRIVLSPNGATWAATLTPEH